MMTGTAAQVLILVVVDDGLVLIKVLFKSEELLVVLILVVVDDGLVHKHKQIKRFLLHVLILVVVDDGLVLDLIRHY